MFPSVAAEASRTRQRLGAGAAHGGEGVEDIAQANLAMSSFEVDLLGRLRNLTDAARSELRATMLDERSARISLISDTCVAYINYQVGRKRVDIVQQTVAARKKTLKLIERSRQVGTVSALDAEESRSLVADAEVQLEQAYRENARAWNALVLLAGTDQLSGCECTIVVPPGFRSGTAAIEPAVSVRWAWLWMRPRLWPSAVTIWFPGRAGFEAAMLSHGDAGFVHFCAHNRRNHP